MEYKVNASITIWYKFYNLSWQRARAEVATTVRDMSQIHLDTNGESNSDLA